MSPWYFLVFIFFIPFHAPVKALVFRKELSVSGCDLLPGHAAWHCCWGCQAGAAFTATGLKGSS